MAKTFGTVHVFISSTFRDMYAERDHLVKFVFPELRERCAKRNLHLIDLDLRWGVTEEEAEKGKVLGIVLNEIDRSRPFFIAILGERYGSVPDKVPEDAESAYPWLPEFPSHSFTALEIVHGMLRNPELARRSFFYFRDAQFLSQLPEKQRVDFVAESPEAARKLAALKENIRSSGRPVMENYPCRWDDHVGRLVDLDVFGQRVLADLWTAICSEYPEEAQEVDPLVAERQIHEAFAEERSRLHVGRVEQAKRLTKYVKGTDRRPVVITGESGCGKSAFLASWYLRYTTEHPEDFVLAYFIGASPDSTNYLRLLRCMCGELKRKFALGIELPEDNEKLPQTLAALLVAASESGSNLRRDAPKTRDDGRIVILLDALDQLAPIGIARGLSWLLDYVPKVRLVMSSLESDCLEVLRRLGAEEIPLPLLTTDEQRQIVQLVLGEWSRKLDERQLSALLAHPGVKNPLYLRVSLEELRLFGRYEQLTDRVKMLANDVAGLFDQTLERLEEDHGRAVVTEAFSLLGCSRYGLSEAEVIDLLRREGEEQFPRALWARLFLSAKAYLVQQGELIGFFHRQLGEAVAARYLRRDNRHAKLAEYFGKAPIQRKVEEYPYQLQRAQQWQTLAAALSDVDFFDYAWNNNREFVEYEWMRYWQSLEGRFEPGSCYQAAIEARLRKEGETANVARLLHGVAVFLGDMALYPFAVPMLQHALAIREHVLNPNDPTDASTIVLDINILGFLYSQQGMHKEALSLFKRALAIQERVLGPNNRSVAYSLHSLGTGYEAQGMCDEALSFYKRALAICERALPDSLLLGDCFNSIGNLYTRQGRSKEALPLLQRALAVYEHNLGTNHPLVATILGNFAYYYNAQGRPDEALSFYKRALAVSERGFGPNHLNVADWLHTLGYFYIQRGQYEEALPLLQRALAIRERVLDPDHPDIASVLNSMGIMYHAQGRHKEAQAFFQRALAVRERVLDPKHPDIAQTLFCLGNLYSDQRMWPEALPLHQRALAIYEHNLEPTDERLRQPLFMLGYDYLREAEFAKALSCLKRALPIFERTLGPNDENTKLCRQYLKLAEEGMRRFR